MKFISLFFLTSDHNLKKITMLKYSISFQSVDESVKDKHSFLKKKLSILSAPSKNIDLLTDELIKVIKTNPIKQYELLSEIKETSLGNIINENVDIRQKMTCFLNSVKNAPDLLEVGEKIESTDFGRMRNKSESYKEGTVALIVKTNLSEFIVMDPNYTISTSTNDIGLHNSAIIDITTGMLVNIAFAIFQGTSIYKFFFGDSTISLDELRKELELSNIEQTIREQNGIVLGKIWDYTNIYPSLEKSKANDYLLFTVQPGLSGALNILADEKHCTNGGPEYITAAIALISVVAEICKNEGKEPYSYPPYKAALNLGLLRLDKIISYLHERRKKDVGPVYSEGVNCRVDTCGHYQCQYYEWKWTDQKTGYTYRNRSRAVKNDPAQGEAKRDRENYLNNLVLEYNWIKDIKNKWTDELKKCK